MHPATAQRNAEHLGANQDGMMVVERGKGGRRRESPGMRCEVQVLGAGCRRCTPMDGQGGRAKASEDSERRRPIEAYGKFE
jgi:hypothetical protein